MKALFFIVTGKENPERFSLALTIAVKSAMNKRYDDLKVIFYGPGEEYLTSINGQDLENFNYLLKNGHVDSACVYYASSKNIKEQLTKLGINLLPTGERLAYYVNQGYEVISF
ncbi:MAG: DsrE family protein [Nitrososphaeria archaeon]|jgi:hypothetical protein